MTGFDYAVLAIVGVSVVLATMRGFVRELLALLTWVAAYFVAQTFYADVVPWLPAEIPGEPLKMLVAFALLMFATWLSMVLLTITLSELIKSAGLAPADRLLGAGFGLLRGILVVLVLVILAGLTKLPQSPIWREATFSAPLEATVDYAKPWLPEGLAKNVHF